jgi:hypothetical protein
MDPLCIICLATLPSAEVLNVDGTPLDQPADGLPGENFEKSPPGKGDVAHLQNCRHKFHDHCIAVWIEVFSFLLPHAELKIANTCPACRSNFNQVDISDTMEGTVPLASKGCSDGVKVLFSDHILWRIKSKQ